MEWRGEAEGEEKFEKLVFGSLCWFVNAVLHVFKNVSGIVLHSNSVNSLDVKHLKKHIRIQMFDLVYNPD